MAYSPRPGHDAARPDQRQARQRHKKSSEPDLQGIERRGSPRLWRPPKTPKSAVRLPPSAGLGGPRCPQDGASLARPSWGDLPADRPLSHRLGEAR
eukprot:4524522-Prymnesium_polylepis.3